MWRLILYTHETPALTVATGIIRVCHTKERVLTKLKFHTREVKESHGRSEMGFIPDRFAMCKSSSVQEININ